MDAAHVQIRRMTRSTLIVGAGPTGRHTAFLLASAGHEVKLVSRKGGRACHPGITHIAADASDARALSALAPGAGTIINCAMPAYDRWPEEFPPIASAVLRAAEAAGADVVTLSNIYGYGRFTGPLTESTPLAPHTVKGRVRAAMWDAALRSPVRATEVRASDYLGHGAVTYFSLFVLPGALRGEASRFPGDVDLPHSWSFTKDVARTLVAAAASDASWGRAWHVPSRSASIRQLANMAAGVAGAPTPQLTRMPPDELQALAAADSMMREVAEMTYLFESACVLDSRETERLLGVSASPLDEALRDTLQGT
jgi:nucleoside-diphosphate-sugar epimerase